jgi:hypothetical protein
MKKKNNNEAKNFKFALEQAIKAHKGSKSTALLFL